MSKKPCNHRFITIFWMTLMNITLLIQMSKKYYPQILIFFFFLDEILQRVRNFYFKSW